MRRREEIAGVNSRAYSGRAGTRLVTRLRENGLLECETLRQIRWESYKESNSESSINFFKLALKLAWRLLEQPNRSSADKDARRGRRHRRGLASHADSLSHTLRI